MKTSMAGIVSAAILMVLAAVGFGIAQAGGDFTDGPVLSFEDQEAYEQSIVSSPYVHVLPSGIDLSYDADGNPSTVVAQARGPVETGAIPGAVFVESWMKEYGND